MSDPLATYLHDHLARPYARKTDLVKKKIISQSVYDQIVGKVIAKRITKKPPK